MSARLTLLSFVIFLFAGVPSFGQAVPSPSLPAAAAATELPLPPWGPYARTHSGLCYLANRPMEQLFAFPIVVGQRRPEMAARTITEANGKKRLKFAPVAIERRMMGLAPLQAEKDDLPLPGKTGQRNRAVQVLEGNAEGTYWKYHAEFAPAAVSQQIAPTLDKAGKPVASRFWGRGEAIIECFPAFAEPRYDGLLYRVTLTNQSDRTQTYFVDILGGMALSGELFSPKDLDVTAETGEESVTLVHSRSDISFGIAAFAPAGKVRSYKVSDAYFSAEASIAPRTATGTTLPVGLYGKRPEEVSKLETPGGGIHGPKPPGGLSDESSTPVPVTLPDSVGRWGLLRVDDIALAPSQSVTFYLCVGTGRETDTARDSAQTLLELARETTADGKPKRDSLYSAALNAHRKVRYVSGEASMDQLMAQSLANLPFVQLRRVGVSSRQATAGREGGQYQPGPGGLMALGWLAYRPDWTATQLNAHFLTRSDPDTPVALPQTTTPTNLFTLWELYQRTGDREMLRKFYPFARKRYQELLTAGRTKQGGYLFAWASPTRLSNSEATRYYASDYAAYVIRAARIMRLLGEQIRQPEEELRGYTADAIATARALNNTLWDAERKTFVARPVGGAGSLIAEEALVNLMPLIAGDEALSTEQRTQLLTSLADPKRFWGAGGLRLTSSSSAPGNTVPYGMNWMLWKALLDQGEAEKASLLAHNLVQAYTQAVKTTNVCPEWVEGDTGASGGASDYAGEVGAVLALQAAYTQAGSVSTGWDTLLLENRYDKATDSLHINVQATVAGSHPAVLCRMDRPNGKYRLSGAMNRDVVADTQGIVSITISQDGVPLRLDLAPIPMDVRNSGKP